MAPQKGAKSLGTVLVVGGCGFVGSAVVDQLLNFPSEDLPTPTSTSTSPSNSITKGSGSKGETHTSPSSSHIIHSDHAFPSLRGRYPSYSQSTTQVHALDLRCIRNRYPGCTYHEADITDPSALQAVFDKVRPDIVINTASPHFDSPPAILRKVNIEGTRSLVEAARNSPSVKAFVHTSSSSVVHDTLSPLYGVDERYPYVYPNAREPYSETKVLAEQLVLEANGTGEQKMLTCAVRPAGVIGEGDMAGFAYSVTKTATTAPSWQLHLQLGDGDNLFDLTYMGNVAYGLLCAAHALSETVKRRDEGKTSVLDFEKIDGEAFNVTNTEPGYFWDLARFLWTSYGRDVDTARLWILPEGWAIAAGWGSEMFARLSGRKARYNRQTARYSCMVRYFNCDKLQKRAGYTPVVSIEEGLQRTVKWFKSMEEGEWKKDEGQKKTQ